MSEKTIEQTVTELIVEQVECLAKKVKPESRFVEDLEFDSLDMVEIIMAAEEAYGVEIPENEVEKISTVGEAIAFLKEKTGGE